MKILFVLLLFSPANAADNMAEVKKTIGQIKQRISNLPEIFASEVKRIDDAFAAVAKNDKTIDNTFRVIKTQQLRNLYKVPEQCKKVFDDLVAEASPSISAIERIVNERESALASVRQAATTAGAGGGCRTPAARQAMLLELNKLKAHPGAFASAKSNLMKTTGKSIPEPCQQTSIQTNWEAAGLETANLFQGTQRIGDRDYAGGPGDSWEKELKGQDTFIQDTQTSLDREAKNCPSLKK